MARIVFLDQGLRGEVAPGTTVLEAAKKLGVRMSHVCDGGGTCSTCRIECVVGAENLTPIEPNEVAFMLGPGVRLGCQARVLGDVGVKTVKIPRAVLG